MPILLANKIAPLHIFLLLPFLLFMPFDSQAARYKAPNFSLKATTGKTIKLSSYKGKVVYLDFWASWCKPCQKSFPWMKKMQQKYKKQGLRIITINLDKDKRELKQFLRTYRANFPVARDPKGRIAIRYGVKAMPTSYLIDRRGRIHHVHLGFLQKDRKKIEHRIRKLLGH